MMFGSLVRICGGIVARRWFCHRIRMTSSRNQAQLLFNFVTDNVFAVDNFLSSVVLPAVFIIDVLIVSLSVFPIRVKRSSNINEWFRRTNRFMWQSIFYLVSFRLFHFAYLII